MWATAEKSGVVCRGKGFVLGAGDPFEGDKGLHQRGNGEVIFVRLMRFGEQVDFVGHGGGEDSRVLDPVKRHARGVRHEPAKCYCRPPARGAVAGFPA